MAALQISPENLPATIPMNSVSASFRVNICFTSARFRVFCGSAGGEKLTQQLIQKKSCKKKQVLANGSSISDNQLRENWLASLSFPLDQVDKEYKEEASASDADFEWVIGVDPDVSGALALLKSNDSGCSAQVFDAPHLQVLVNRGIRKRLDAKSIVQLLRGFGAPLGTTAYIEQATPFPKDGKQGWWGGGFGYGLWIGILVALGFSVVPVPSVSWKNYFDLSGGTSTKDDSREAASVLFPSLGSQLKRKKDHGRAEALLIAAYGKGLRIKTES